MNEPYGSLTIQLTNKNKLGEYVANRKFNCRIEHIIRCLCTVPATKVDFALVQHMIYHLAENGIMAIMLPHGVLFRGVAKQHSFILQTYF
ncbi:N-6 DNA methylase [Dyadobacter sp. LHD-138]|uniref:N-6 DNA methylase n=1 Tax=Dyadobacter sp. LHD-138 TaxID=3071413 RepID=UPI0038D3E5E1